MEGAANQGSWRGKERDPPPEPPKEMQPDYNTTLAPETSVELLTCTVVSHVFVVIGYSSHRNLMQQPILIFKKRHYTAQTKCTCGSNQAWTTFAQSTLRRSEGWDPPGDPALSLLHTLRHAFQVNY